MIQRLIDRTPVWALGAAWGILACSGLLVAGCGPHAAPAAYADTPVAPLAWERAGDIPLEQDLYRVRLEDGSWLYHQPANGTMLHVRLNRATLQPEAEQAPSPSPRQP